MRIYIKNKNNFENFLILIFAIIFIIFSIVISDIYGTEGLMAIIVLLTICCFGIIAVMLIILAIYVMVIHIKNTFGIKFDRSKVKDKDIPKYANRIGWTQPVYVCPTCGARLISPDICIECGQRIRWTDPKNEGW